MAEIVVQTCSCCYVPPLCCNL